MLHKAELLCLCAFLTKNNKKNKPQQQRNDVFKGNYFSVALFFFFLFKM